MLNAASSLDFIPESSVHLFIIRQAHQRLHRRLSRAFQLPKKQAHCFRGTRSGIQRVLFDVHGVPMPSPVAAELPSSPVGTRFSAMCTTTDSCGKYLHPLPDRSLSKGASWCANWFTWSARRQHPRKKEASKPSLASFQLASALTRARDITVQPN